MIGIQTTEQAVSAANHAFYEAFAHGDVDAMDEVWARQRSVACIHPGWGAIHGRDQVMRTWHVIMQAGATPISCEEVQVIMLEDSAFVTCVEDVGGNRLVATNIFVLEAGVWKIVHHQAGPFHESDATDVQRPPDNQLN